MNVLRRLSVRLNLIIVLVILFEWGFLFALPNTLFELRTPQVETISPETPDQQFGEVARRVLDDDSLSDAQKRARLEPLLRGRVASDSVPLAETSQLLVAVYEPRAVFTPLFWFVLLLFPTLTLAFLLRWWLVGPLERLAHAASRVTNGDLSTRVAPPHAFAHQGDELYGLTERFNVMVRTLQINERERQRMVTDIAHELRTPLAIMRAQLDGMLEAVIPTSRAELLSLGEEADLLTRLVEDLRLLSLAEAERLSLDGREVDLVTLLESVVQSFAVVAAERRIHLNLDVPPQRVVASVDPERMRQVLGNLLQNALHYTPLGGEVRLELKSSANSVHLSVADTGPGIPQADLPHLFDRFYRAEKSRVRAEGGSGLGLTIVRALVELHGGHVEASSEPGSGAVFAITLPAQSHLDPS